MAELVIAGDLAPLGRNQHVFESGSFPSIFDLELAPPGAMVVANLECPLSGSGAAIVKGGPALRAPAGLASALWRFGISAVNLANNHIMDYGDYALEETIACLSREKISFFGAGRSLQEALQPLNLTFQNERIRFFGFAEKEYNIATDRSPGAAPLELPIMVRALKSTTRDSFVVVLFHAGNEYFEYPSPWLRDTCRLAVELGADVVVCQHSHCIGCYERYAGGLIVYGQGNFIFDTATNKKCWWQGVLLRVRIEDGSLKHFDFVPFRQAPRAGIVEPLEAESRANLLKSFEDRSKILLDEEKFLGEWDRFCESNRRQYQSHLFGLGRIGRRANRLLGFCDLVPRKGQRNIGNVLRCQSHLEVLRQLYSREKTC